MDEVWFGWTSCGSQLTPQVISLTYTRATWWLWRPPRPRLMWHDAFIGLVFSGSTASLFITPPPNEVGGPAQRSWRPRPRPTKLEGGYTGFTLSVCPSVRPSACRRHGFRSISQVCFGISISNFICMLMVAIGRSLLIFSDDTYKMAAWRPYWIFWFPDSNFTLALNINFKLQRHNTYVYG